MLNLTMKPRHREVEHLPEITQSCVSVLKARGPSLHHIPAPRFLDSVTGLSLYRWQLAAESSEKSELGGSGNGE